MFMKSLQILFMIAAFSAYVMASQDGANKIAGVPTIEAKDDKSGVILELYENQNLPMGLGFSVFIEGWVPNDSIKLEAISPTEQSVSLLNNGATLPVSPEGKIEFSLPYKHKNLYPGRWVLVVYGKSGAHAHYFNVPQPVERNK
jgi:hypothetical protein